MLLLSALVLELVQPRRHQAGVVELRYEKASENGVDNKQK